MKRIVFKKEGGGVSIITIAPGHDIDSIMGKHVPYGAAAIVADDKDLPPFDEFVDAWELVDGKVSVNMDKCKEIKKNSIRRDRDRLFPGLDVAFIRAQEEGRDVSQIVKEKQRLRDAPASVDRCITLNDIRSIKC